MAGIEQARLAKAHLALELAGRGDVRGIGIRRAPQPSLGYELQVNVAAADADGVPDDVDGVEVHVRVVGRLHAQR